MANAIYANARAKSLENGLLGIDRLERMAESGSADEAIKILSEVNFGDGISIASASEFEKLLSVEEKNFLDFVRADCPSEALKKYILLPYDFHNAEAFIRQKHLKKDIADLTVSSGTIEKDALKDKIMLDEYKSFPEELAKALLYADVEFVSGRATGSSINAAFKKALYTELNKCAVKVADLKEIFSVKADCANVGVALRTRNYAAAKNFFVVGGKISGGDLKVLCEENLEILKDKCKYMPNAELCVKAVESAAKGEPLSEFEKSADGYALSLLKKKKYSTEGIVPFMLYCYYKLAEIKNVRIIIVGLTNGIESAEIKRRLRDSYER